MPNISTFIYLYFHLFVVHKMDSHLFQSLIIHPFVSYNLEHESLFLTESITQNTILMSIPKCQIICFSNIPLTFKEALTPLKSLSINNNKLDHEQVILALYLIYLKKSSKIIVKGIDWFNRQSHGFALFEESEIRKTHNQDLIIQYFAYRNHLKQITKAIFQQLQSKKYGGKFRQDYWQQFSAFEKEYIWAVQFKNSRSFGYTNETVLIPFLDFLNHSSKNNVQMIISQKQKIDSEAIAQEIDKYQDEEHSDNDQNSDEDRPNAHIESYPQDGPFYMHMIATKNILQGEELFLNYGRRNNSYLLKWYGFVQKNNPKDTLIIYYCPYSDHIYFNSLEKSAKIFKLKLNLFNVELLVSAKKQYFQQYYHFPPGKIFWTLPLDLDFEEFMVEKVINRLKKYYPERNKDYDVEKKGERWLKLFEQEQIKIYERQIQYFQMLKFEISKRKEKNQSKEISRPSQLQIEKEQGTYPELLQDYVNKIRQL